MTKTDAAHIIVADSSGIVSLVKSDDSNHARALEALDRAGVLAEPRITVLVPPAVFIESINTLNRRVSRSVALQAAEVLQNTRPFVVLGEDELAAGLDRFRSQKSTSVSLTDCIVMATADRYETRSIFGFDEHFRKRGYTLVGGTEVAEAA